MVLNSYTVSIPAGTVTPQSIGGMLDWQYDDNQNRRLTVQLAAGADSVLVEGTLDGTNWWALAAAVTGNTNANPIAVTGPIKQIRATKTGTAGAATVTAIV